MPDGAPPDETAEVETPLATDPEHAGVEDEALEAAAAAAFTPPADDNAPATDAVVEPEPGDGEGEGGGGESEGEPPSPAPDLIEISEGVTMSREDAASWAQFQAYLQANPDVARRVAEVLDPNVAQQEVATPETPATPATPTIPEGIDLDDPAIAALWNQHQATLETMARLEAIVQRHDQYVQQNEMETTQALLQTARTTYQERHNLSDQEMQTVYDVAGRLQVLPSLMAAVDPVSGLPRQIDPLTAMQEAFDIARNNIPTLREREMQLKVDAQKADTKRKTKLSSLGGSSGSSPKHEPEPKNAQERRLAMIQAVADMTNGEGA